MRYTEMHSTSGTEFRQTRVPPSSIAQCYGNWIGGTVLCASMNFNTYLRIPCAFVIHTFPMQTFAFVCKSEARDIFHFERTCSFTLKRYEAWKNSVLKLLNDEQLSKLHHLLIRIYEICNYLRKLEFFPRSRAPFCSLAVPLYSHKNNHLEN